MTVAFHNHYLNDATILRVLFLINIRDSQSGMWIFKKEAYFLSIIVTYLYIINDMYCVVRRVRRRESLVLDKEEEKIVRLFTELGMPGNLSKTLMYLCQVDECRSADVERGADLRQPEVSVAMQELRKRGWVKKRDLKKKGKGRPVHIYEATMDLSKVWKSLEQEKLKEIECVKSDLSKLENIIKNR